MDVLSQGRSVQVILERLNNCRAMSRSIVHSTSESSELGLRKLTSPGYQKASPQFGSLSKSRRFTSSL
uniref:Uncharacterized protein n=1 Tax=Pristionchus pacificus TaxID=54126 RepID=A0A2A6CYH7_PRIPA|eukprot:PDM83225.1 hypothetical protein PRIPAC_34857 [Pristionchus pacificus]